MPGLLRHGELSDFAGLIAPRPCLVETADRDSIFPIEAVRATVEQSSPAWAAFGAAEQLETAYFFGRRAYDFLADHL